jgi:hypothetical protein
METIKPASILVCRGSDGEDAVKLAHFGLIERVAEPGRPEGCWSARRRAPEPLSRAGCTPVDPERESGSSSTASRKIFEHARRADLACDDVRPIARTLIIDADPTPRS